MKKFLKIMMYISLTFLVLSIIGILLHPFILGPAIKAGVEKIGPMVTKTKITLESAHVNMFKGVVELRGMKVDNPEGYKTEAAVKVGAVKIKLSPMSVLSNTIHVQTVLVDGAEAWYEMGIPSNVGQIQKNVDDFLGADKAAAETEKPKAKSDKPGKKVVIDDLQILNTKVHVGIKGIGGAALPIVMPDIKKKDLGKDGDGKSIGQMCGEVFKSILGGISDAGSSAGKAIGNGAKAVGGAAADAGKAIGSGIKNLFGGSKK